MDGNVIAGRGGDGSATKNGGAGGDLKVVSLLVEGNISAMAGDGGNAVNGGSGKGGSISATGAFANKGTGDLLAGNAGALGTKAANGGSIIGTGSQLSALRAAITLNIIAGDGANGGNGGDVKGLSFGSTSDSLRPTPAGNILIQAGDGSGLGSKAGKGGSIDEVTGNPSSGTGTTTKIIAGIGGSTDKKGGVGGSLSDINISGVGDDTPLDAFGFPIANSAANPVTIIFQAGNAGDSLLATRGAKGGDVKNIAVTNLDPDAHVRSVAAGDGGQADLVKGQGGDGGSVTGVRLIGGADLVTDAILSADIGIRSGQVFGYDTMGGVFAGAGGAGGKTAKAGSVSNVSADSIAAIVAGRSAVPQLVEKVEKISLNGLTRLKTAGNSPFTITYDTNMGTTVLLPDRADAKDVETAINNIGGVVPTVDVIKTQNSSFQITSRIADNIGQFTGTEEAPVEVTEVLSGTQTFPTQEIAVGTATTVERQAFTPFAQGTFTLSYGIDKSTPLNSATATAQEVEDALNLLPTISAVGSVTVAGSAAAGFEISFTQAGVQAPIIVTSQVPEQQSVDVLGVGGFTLSYLGQATAVLGANATAAEVEAALNGLTLPGGGGPAIVGGVTVTDGPVGSSSYLVTFNDTPDPDPFLIQGTEFIPMNATTITEGAAGIFEKQGVSFVSRNTFTKSEYAIANIVGAIVDPNEIGAPIFKYTKGAGNVGAGFELGDTPIDGLIMARIFNQDTVNFTPEAKYVTTDNGKDLPAGQNAFYDFDNKI